MNQGTMCRIDCPEGNAVLERKPLKEPLERSKIAINAPDSEGVCHVQNRSFSLDSFLLRFYKFSRREFMKCRHLPRG